MAGEPGALVTLPEDGSDSAVAEPVFTPKDFRLNLGSRLAVATDDPATTVSVPVAVAVATDNEPRHNLDNPAIRKLTWEHVVPDRPASSAPSAATLVPLPPPRRVPPPPPQPVSNLRPPAPVTPEPEPAVVDSVPEEELIAAAAIADEVIEVEVIEHVVQQAPPVIQPEVNRLGSVPDLFDDDDDAPIELPAITPSGPIVAHNPTPYTPVLAETLYIPPPSRPATSMVTAVVVDQGKQKKAQPKKAQQGRTNRKPKRHLLRSFVILVVLFGLLAGGAFAAKKYLLHQPTWSDEFKPLADDVALTRGLQFETAVEVTPVPVADYATRLAGSAIPSRPETGSTWRALGLLNGELDLQAIGRQALNDSPAFYDPTTKTIYVSDDLAAQPHLYRFAIRRAMTVALLDQQFDWSGRLTAASPATALVIRATIDGDALTVANTLAATDGADLLAPELSAFVQGHGATVAPSQYGATISGRVGVAMRPMVASVATDSAALAALEQTTPSSDGVFDAGRSPAIVASPSGTQGMMFWYYVLASRIDDSQAWLGATRWMGDSLAASTGASNQCVDVKIAAADADGAAVLLGAFGAWAAAAPPESTTTVVPIDGNQVAIRACDPTPAISAQLPARIPVVFGGAGVELSLLHAAASAAATTGTATVDSACLITAARQRGVALTSPGDDAPVLVVDWLPAYVAANLDLGAGCVVAPPDAAAPVAVAPTP